MNEQPPTPPVVPESTVQSPKRAGLPLIWLVPIVAALAGIWIAVTTIRNEGPKITIEFRTADGLEADKTKVRYNGIEVGIVSDLQFTPNHQKVIATVRMNPKTGEFLVKDTQFWVVRPEISGANISGLGTLVSGAYIGMEIGEAKETTRHFTALEAAPMEVGGVHGNFYTLKATEIGSVSKGSPVYFRRLPVGQVADYELDPAGKFLNVKIFVRAPYDHYVTTDTRFWQASGIEASLSTAGIKLHVESLLSLMVGGIAFAPPAGDPVAPPAGTGADFTLFKDREQAFRPPPVNPQTYVIVFNQSVRGLQVGAPVEFAGIPIGEVTEVRAQFDARTYEFSVPVTILVDLPRFGVKLVGQADGTNFITNHQVVMNALIARGLRAQLRTGSLVSGSKLVALDFFPSAAPVAIDWSQQPVQLPALLGSLDSLQEDIAGIAKKINQMPLVEIGDGVHKTITDLDRTIAGVQSTLTNTDRLLNDADRLIAPDSALDLQLPGLLQEAGGAARAMRLLGDYLERHPEALIRGKAGDGN